MGVHESHPEQPGRRSRHDEVADEAERVRDQDRVAEPLEVVVSPNVDPEHGETDDGELGEPVCPRHGGLEEVPLVDEVLKGQLVEPVREAGLEVDDCDPVCERLRGIPVGEAANELVEDEEAEPDRKLTTEIGPSARQMPAPGCNHRRHLKPVILDGLPEVARRPKTGRKWPKTGF